MKKLLCLAAATAALFAPAPKADAGVTFLRQRSGCVIDRLTVQPSAAWALRRVSCLYLGPALRVTRASDNTTLDIAFVGPALDTAALAAFCVGTSCAITTWYDQSGHARDQFCTAGATLCPQIWLAGAYAGNIGARPAILMNATFNIGLHTIGADAGIISTTAGAMFSVANAVSGLPGDVTASWWVLPILMVVHTANNNGIAAQLGTFVQGGVVYSPPSYNAGRYEGTWLGTPTDMFVTTPYTYGSSAIFGLRWDVADGTPTKSYYNGGTPGTDASTANNNASTVICYPLGGNACAPFSRAFVGTTSEGYVFSSEPSLTDANLLGNDMANWFSLTWTNITL